MRGRVLLLLLLIVLLLVVVVVFVLPEQTGNGGGTTANETPNAVTLSPLIPTATPIARVNIVIALQELPRGYRFPDNINDLENVVALFPWPQEMVPFNAITEEDGGLERMINKIARTDIFREQPILSNMLVDNLSEIARIGSDAAAILPPNLVAVAIPMDRLTSVAYGVADGDRVDIIMSMLFVDVDEVFQSLEPNEVTLFNVTAEGAIEFLAGIQGRPDSGPLGPVIVGPSERQRPRLVTQRTIQDAFVVHVGNFPPNGRFIGVVDTPTPVPVTAAPADGQQAAASGQATAAPPTAIPRPDIVTLGVTPQDAVIITWAVEAHLPLTLALRSATDTSRVPTEAVTLDFIMNEFRIEVPGKRPFAIEPAIRSIRQLLAGNEISLGSDTGDTIQSSAAPPQ